LVDLIAALSNDLVGEQKRVALPWLIPKSPCVC
jgi:hypothetical protein